MLLAVYGNSIYRSLRMASRRRTHAHARTLATSHPHSSTATRTVGDCSCDTSYIAERRCRTSACSPTGIYSRRGASEDSVALIRHGMERIGGVCQPDAMRCRMRQRYSIRCTCRPASCSRLNSRCEGSITREVTEYNIENE